jgi:hypothetical protein
VLCHDFLYNFAIYKNILLISSQKFSEVCYTISGRHELLNAINHFLDETIVLPSSDWDKTTLLSMSKIHELQIKKCQWLAVIEKITEEKILIRKMSAAEVFTKPELKNEGMRQQKDLSQVESEKVYNPLIRTAIPFGGMINEIKNRVKLFKSDITDSFSLMCIAAIIFIFFAALSGAIALGGLYGNTYFSVSRFFLVFLLHPQC